MKTSTSEIRVALIGYVSVGKSTVLNALLGDKFSEVSMKRTTAAVNFFRIKAKDSNDADADAKSSTSSSSEVNSKKLSKCDDRKASASSRGRTNKHKRNQYSPSPVTVSSESSDDTPAADWSVVNDGSTKDAAVTHEEIRSDNEALRKQEEGYVVEKCFDIAIDVPIYESIRPDTNITLVDIPGINEAESRIKYKNYVSSSWDTFDCAIVVLDATQGVNSQEQIDILNFVKNNNDEKKNIPTIILGNKVDDPDDEEALELVAETQAKCIKMFGNGCSKVVLNDIVQRVNKGKSYPTGDPKALFIPISARDAYFYRKASHLTLETFDDLDKNTAEKIGKDEVGRRWKKMSKTEKFKVIQEALGTKESYEERLKSTNFGLFLKSIAYFVGTADAQTHLLSHQIDVGLTKLGFDTERSASSLLHDIYKACNAVGRSIQRPKKQFWKVYNDYETAILTRMESTPNPAPLARLFKELEDFYELSTMLEWKDEAMTCSKRIEDLVRRQLDMIISKEKSWTISDFYTITGIKWDTITGINWGRESFKDESLSSWQELSPEDWKVLIFSVLLPADDRYFAETFGVQKFSLVDALPVYQTLYNPRITKVIYSGNSGYNIDDSELRSYLDHFRVQGGNVDDFHRLKVPESLNDPSHWGHIVWRYVKFCHSHPKNKSD